MDLGEGAEAAAGEAADEDVEEGLDLGAREVAEAVGEVPLDGLDAEGAGELLGQFLDVPGELSPGDRVEVVGCHAAFCWSWGTRTSSTTSRMVG